MPALNAVVSRRVDAGPELAIFRVEPKEFSLTGFEPGQFAVLGLPEEAPCCDDSVCACPGKGRLIKRAYSIASPPEERDYLEFSISLVKTGALTPRLFALEEGDGVWLSPRCAGAFSLTSLPAAADLVMIGTGTGLAPYMSLVRSFAAQGRDDRRLAVIHGVRHVHDLAYRDELEMLAGLIPGLVYLPVVSRPGEAFWSGLSGHVQDVWNARILDSLWGRPVRPETAHVCLCGNPAMVEAMEQLLAAEGFIADRPGVPGTLHVERYW